MSYDAGIVAAIIGVSVTVVGWLWRLSSSVSTLQAALPALHNECELQIKSLDAKTETNRSDIKDIRSHHLDTERELRQDIQETRLEILARFSQLEAKIDQFFIRHKKDENR